MNPRSFEMPPREVAGLYIANLHHADDAVDELRMLRCAESHLKRNPKKDHPDEIFVKRRISEILGSGVKEATYGMDPPEKPAPSGDDDDEDLEDDDDV
jgi:hypothetical protein